MRTAFVIVAVLLAGCGGRDQPRPQSGPATGPPARPPLHPGAQPAATKPGEPFAPPGGAADQRGSRDGKDGHPAKRGAKLAKSGGIICPPNTADNDIHAAPPGGGKIEVIPPPGTPQNQPNVQPK